MSRFQLSAGARLDFYEALNSISDKSLAYADKWESRMLDAFSRLADWPLRGMVRPEYGSPDLRFWIEGDYVVLYDPTTAPLSIVAILHGAQDLPNLLGRRVHGYEIEDLN